MEERRCGKGLWENGLWKKGLWEKGLWEGAVEVTVRQGLWE